jgi:hypothetical protein
MSRSRSAPGHRQPSKHERTFAQRQWVRDYKRQLTQEHKPTLAERVLPWRKRKARREAERRTQALALVKQHEAAQRFRRTHRQAWRGIHTLTDSRRLLRIGLKRIENGEARAYDHPQQRRLERMERQGRPPSVWPGAV